MRLKLKSKNETCFLIVFTAVALLPLKGFAKPKPIMTTDILKHLRKGEPWDRGVFTATKMVMFQQATNTTGGTDATSIAKITLNYFTSTDCTATNGTSVPTYTTPDGTSFTINTTTPFGMVAASAWNVGNSEVSPAVADMTAIQSIAVTFKSTNNNTPQASFTGISFACVPVTCSSGECTSGSGTQSFQLKTTAAIGDPADGGIIACTNGGLNNLVVPTTDNSTGIPWDNENYTGAPVATSATSTTDGSTNTNTIVSVLTTTEGETESSYAAGLCAIYSAAGGFTSGWFLPAGRQTGSSQLNCLAQNRTQIATGAAVSGGSGFVNTSYWSSTESSTTNALFQNLITTGRNNSAKTTNNFRVRCSRVFTS